MAYEYSRKTREVTRTLLQGISESLGLEATALEDYTGFDSGLQVFVVNLYPPCPQPELALGLPPHTDNGLLTLLYQNGVGGLQVKHDGKWVNVDPLPNCLIVNVADQLEVGFSWFFRFKIDMGASKYIYTNIIGIFCSKTQVNSYKFGVVG